jgi:hypothetical protein
MTTPLPVLPNVFRVTFLYTPVAGQAPPANVMHFHTSQTGTAAGNLYTAINANVTSAMWGSLTTGTFVTTVNIIQLDGVSPTFTYSTGSPTKWQGTSGGTATPQVSTLLKLGTGHRGRSYRGRIYLPNTASSAFSIGVVSGPLVTSIGAAWNTFINALAVATPTPYTLQVVSYQRPPAHGAPFTTDVTTLTCESYTATQRRRQPGRKVSRH